MKKEDQTEITISIKGLASGTYRYVFSIDQSFFEQFENQDISKAHLESVIQMEKQADWIRLDVALQGTVVRPCDRCLEDVVIPITYAAPLVIKFSTTVEEVEQGSDEVLFVEPAAPEINLTQYLYDSICLSLPLITLHQEGDCDPQMEQKIAELTVNR